MRPDNRANGILAAMSGLVARFNRRMFNHKGRAPKRIRAYRCKQIEAGSPAMVETGGTGKE